MESFKEKQGFVRDVVLVFFLLNLQIGFTVVNVIIQNSKQKKILKTLGKAKQDAKKLLA